MLLLSILCTLAYSGDMFLPMERRYAVRAGFTMPELLVAIVLVAVLALLLGGAWQDISVRVGGVKCMGNLRQIAMAAFSWCAENDGRLPDMGQWYSTSKGDKYSLLPYVGIPADGQKVDSPNVLTCPVYNRKYPTTSSPIRTYAINRYAVGSVVKDEDDWKKILANEPPELLKRVAQPSRTLFFMDGRPSEGNLSGAAPSAVYRRYAAPDSIAPGVTPRLHGDGLNVVYLDGHLEQISNKWIEEQRLTVTAMRTHVFWGAAK